MADNTTITPGAGATIAADDIGGGVLAQRVKPVWGPDGTGNDIDVASGKSLPVQVRSATGLIPIGEPTDAKNAATDGTSVSLVSLLKQISATLQAGIVAALGQTTKSASMSVTVASDDDKIGTSREFAVVGTTLTRPANTTTYTAGDAISDNATAGSVTVQPVTVSDVNDAPITLADIILDTNDTGLAAAINVDVFVYNSDPTASSGVGGGDNSAFSNKKAGFVGRFRGTFLAFSDGGKAICRPVDGDNTLMQVLNVKPGSGAKTLWLQYKAVTGFTPSANSTTIIPTVRGFQGRA